MTRKISEKQQKELDFVKEWCLTILDFITKRHGETPIMTQSKEVINTSYLANNLKGLRYCEKDFNEWAKGLSKNDVDELNNILGKKFGKNINDSNNKTSKKINTIVKRGKINTDDEFRLLMARVDEIYTDDNKKSELESINKLLVDYEK